jgi:hypothetical protein
MEIYSGFDIINKVPSYNLYILQKKNVCQPVPTVHILPVHPQAIQPAVLR